MSQHREDRLDVQRRKRPCKLCQDKVIQIDFKDAQKLRRFLSEQGKILSRRITGNCAEHQREITLAIKRSREIGLVESGL